MFPCFQPVLIKDVSCTVLLAVVKYVYTDTVDTTVSPLELVELMRGECACLCPGLVCCV